MAVNIVDRSKGLCSCGSSPATVRFEKPGFVARRGTPKEPVAETTRLQLAQQLIAGFGQVVVDAATTLHAGKGLVEWLGAVKVVLFDDFSNWAEIVQRVKLLWDVHAGNRAHLPGWVASVETSGGAAAARPTTPALEGGHIAIIVQEDGTPEPDNEAGVKAELVRKSGGTVSDAEIDRLATVFIGKYRLAGRVSHGGYLAWQVALLKAAGVGITLQADLLRQFRLPAEYGKGEEKPAPITVAGKSFATAVTARFKTFHLQKKGEVSFSDAEAVRLGEQLERTFTYLKLGDVSRTEADAAMLFLLDAAGWLDRAMMEKVAALGEGDPDVEHLVAFYKPAEAVAAPEGVAVEGGAVAAAV